MTDDNLDLSLLRKRIEEMQSRMSALHPRDPEAVLKPGGGGDNSGGMDVVRYRLDQFEKRADAADVRMGRIEDKLGAIQMTLAGLATKDTVRGWAITVAAIVITTGVAAGALLLQSANNQLAAFQSGLTAIEGVASAHQLAAPHGATPTLGK